MKKIIIIILIALGISGFYLSNKKTDNIESPSLSSDNKTYTNDELGFSFEYPETYEVSIKEDSKRMGALISFEFENNSGSFDALVSCFDGNTWDPFYLGEFRDSEDITIANVNTKIYRDQNRGFETLSFYIPLINENLNRCGILFQSFDKLSDDSMEIINSIEFTDGFQNFTEKVNREFKLNPPTKG